MRAPIYSIRIYMGTRTSASQLASGGNRRRQLFSALPVATCRDSWLHPNCGMDMYIGGTMLYIFIIIIIISTSDILLHCLAGRRCYPFISGICISFFFFSKHSKHSQFFFKKYIYIFFGYDNHCIFFQILMKLPLRSIARPNCLVQRATT